MTGIVIFLALIGLVAIGMLGVVAGIVVSSSHKVVSEEIRRADRKIFDITSEGFRQMLAEARRHQQR